MSGCYIYLLLAECEVRTASYARVFSFVLWPKREACGPWKQGRKKRGSITCHMDRANEANKMFITWLCWLFLFWKGDRSARGLYSYLRTWNWPITAHEISQPYNKTQVQCIYVIIIILTIVYRLSNQPGFRWDYPDFACDIFTRFSLKKMKCRILNFNVWKNWRNCKKYKKIKYFYAESIELKSNYWRFLTEIVVLEYQKWYFRASRFKNFLGGMPQDPPSKRCLRHLRQYLSENIIPI